LKVQIIEVWLHFTFYKKVKPKRLRVWLHLFERWNKKKNVIKRKGEKKKKKKRKKKKRKKEKKIKNGN